MYFVRLVISLLVMAFSFESNALPVPGVKAGPLYCMATNVFYEARGDGERSRLLVALVTANRAIKSKRDICSVVYRPYQFSWTVQPQKVDMESLVEQRAWKASVQTAKKVLSAMKSKTLHKVDFTRGSTHYHAKMPSHDKNPGWAKKMTLMGRAGKHLYYADVRSTFR